MRRTTSRSSTRSGSRRASSSRSKRSKRAARPRLSTRQVREIVGVLLMLAALLGVLAILSHAGSILGFIRDGMVAGFGSAWFVPVVAAIALSAYLLWPKAPRPRGIDFVAGMVTVLSLIGLVGLAAGAGGSAGSAIDSALIGLVTRVGAWALLIAGLVIGLIVTIHFSPGALLVAVFFFSSRRRHTRSLCDWSSDVCSSDLAHRDPGEQLGRRPHVVYGGAEETVARGIEADEALALHLGEVEHLGPFQTQVVEQGLHHPDARHVGRPAEVPREPDLELPGADQVAEDAAGRLEVRRGARDGGARPAPAVRLLGALGRQPRRERRGDRQHARGDSCGPTNPIDAHGVIATIHVIICIVL